MPHVSRHLENEVRSFFALSPEYCSRSLNASFNTLSSVSKRLCPCGSLECNLSVIPFGSTKCFSRKRHPSLSLC